VVVAADITLHRLSQTLSRHQITPSSEVVLMGGDGSALAYRNPDRLIRKSGEDGFRIARLNELGSDVLAFLSKDLAARPQGLDFRFAGQPWKGSLRKLAKLGGLGLYVLMVSPVHELLSEAAEIRRLSLITTFVVFLVAMPVIWLVARRISDPLRRLAGEAGLIRRFDFAAPVETHSFITEVDELARAMDMMKTTISRFLTLIKSLAGEKDFDSLLARITRETMLVGQADAVLSYLVDDDERHLGPASLQGRERGPIDTDPLPRLPMDSDHALVQAVKQQGSSLLRLGEGDALAPLLDALGASTLSMVALPLRNRQEEIIGVLCLIYRKTAEDQGLGQQDAQIAFVRALSGFAAVSLESRHLLMMQEALLDAFIKLIAGAIDAKSPYTGGHCQRVPELTRMLAQAACDSDAPPFRDFRLDPEQWEALEIASWLHDCGKVTTPEYVVDKATKLETLYDRIHEIRMRFEVLKRDAEIRYWRALAEGGERQALKQDLGAVRRELDEDFAFVAECNLGGEFMAPERIEHLERIGARTWMRTLDDRLGTSWEERRRKDRVPARSLPVEERLLDDRPEHLIEREEGDRIPEDNPWGFRLDVPHYKYNRGELYNLRIAQGTLNAEERYKINDHIVQTIIMLERLPYPRHLRQVPLIAGCHHETLDGKGYPRRLTKDQMPLTARMMAIADIFEALTASDRPYKQAKTLSEAVRIMGFMRRERHIDPELFELFLSSGVWLEYGRRFLKPEQIDALDIAEYLAG
jgi:HD-GYP domain-containing protein (c-di-GMP phosphodiesterase class II)